MSDPVVILGLGFTTQRLARRLRHGGREVYAAVRDAGRFGEFAELGLWLCGFEADQFPKGVVLIHSVPPPPEPEKPAIRRLIREIAPRRILYISSTGVYGAQSEVSEKTVAEPNDDKGRARIEEEEWIVGAEAPWSSLILRSAAIYGPGRGIHVRLRDGRLRKEPRRARGIVSRIHVDDLVALLEAGIDSQIRGAWPVADDNPATSEEVAAWSARQMGIDLPEGREDSPDVTGRSVNGRKIRELLGVELKYPSYQAGITASLLEEGRT